MEEDDAVVEVFPVPDREPLEVKDLEQQTPVSSEPGAIASDFPKVISQEESQRILDDIQIDDIVDELIAEDSPTNPSESLQKTFEKYTNAAFGAGKDLLSAATDKVSGILGGIFGSNKPTNKDIRKPSATAAIPKPAVGRFSSDDTRVKLAVPESYVRDLQVKTTSIIRTSSIIFPYSPSIKVGHSASYTPTPVTHSNYTQYFYKNSSVDKITISAKFSVQNEQEAEQLISVNHLLRSLTKMRFGKDTDAGAPPPVCRLFAYGDYMLDNTPVVVESFSMEVPDSVDYYSMLIDNRKVAVPVLTTISITLLPMFSRNEILNSSVSGWLSGVDRKNGLL